MENKSIYPKDFLWGVASSAYQSEGAYKEDGKSLSNQDKLNGTNGFHDTTVTADFYHHYKEDIKLMAEMGLKSFRFSISWSRLFPDGETYNPKGGEFYNNVIDELLKYNITPMITIYHFEHPQVLQDKFNGWYSEQMIDYYMIFAKKVFELYGDRVKYYLTICEQNNVVIYPHLIGGYPEGVDIERWRMQVLRVMSLCSAKAIKLCHKMIPDAKIGACYSFPPSYPASSSPEDVIAAMNENDHRDFYGMDLVYKHYQKPWIVNYYKEKGIDIELSKSDIETLSDCKPDFIAYNYYRSNTAKECPKEVETVQPKFNLSGKKGNITYSKFPGLYQNCANEHLEKNEWDWAIDAKGLYISLRMLYDRYNLPIMVVENGLGAYDKVENGLINDECRIDYLKKHIEQLTRAISDGIEVWGYYIWSFTDVMSTSNGFSKRYGLVYVDRTDDDPKQCKRVCKNSYYWYKDVIKKNGGID